MSEGEFKMPRKQQPEMESWVAQWPVGSKGLFGGHHPDNRPRTETI